MQHELGASAERHHLDGHRVPAGRLDRDADLRPARRHVRQGALPGDLARRCSRSARSCARSRTRSALMIVGRGLQGLGGGVFPLSFGIIRDEFPREQGPDRHRAARRDRRDRLGDRPAARRRARRRPGLPLDLLARRRSWASLATITTILLRARVAGPHAGPRRLRRRRHPRRRPDRAADRASRAAPTGAGARPRTLGLIAGGLVVLVAVRPLRAPHAAPLVNMQHARPPPGADDRTSRRC